MHVHTVYMYMYMYMYVENSFFFINQLYMYTCACTFVNVHMYMYMYIYALIKSNNKKIILVKLLCNNHIKEKYVSKEQCCYELNFRNFLCIVGLQWVSVHMYILITSVGILLFKCNKICRNFLHTSTKLHDTYIYTEGRNIPFVNISNLNCYWYRSIELDLPMYM